MDYRFSRSAMQLRSSAVREILKLTQGSDVISFAGGLPAEEFFPIEAVRAAFERVFDAGQACLQYGLTEGYPPLRDQVARRLREKGIRATASDILLTTGSQQAIDLLARVCLDPGDVVLVQEPTYLAALQAFQTREARVVPVAGDLAGMALDDASSKIQLLRPKLAYVSPTFANPTGCVWSLERRKGLLDLCRAHDVLILEDDPYGDLQFEAGARFPPIMALDSHPDDSAVVYTGTFSKTVAPALRTGWAVGAPGVIQAMARVKQSADLHSSSLDQQALHQLLAAFDLDAHIGRLREEYRSRMRAMSDGLRSMEGPCLRWSDPQGGMFLWVELPEAIDAEALLRAAVQEGVAFVPGRAFYAGEPKRNAMRLNFTHTGPERMAVGIERLASALRTHARSTTEARRHGESVGKNRGEPDGDFQPPLRVPAGAHAAREGHGAAGGEGGRP